MTPECAVVCIRFKGEKYTSGSQTRQHILFYSVQRNVKSNLFVKDVHFTDVRDFLLFYFNVYSFEANVGLTIFDHELL